MKKISLALCVVLGMMQYACASEFGRNTTVQTAALALSSGPLKRRNIGESGVTVREINERVQILQENVGSVQKLLQKNTELLIAVSQSLVTNTAERNSQRPAMIACMVWGAAIGSAVTSFATTVFPYFFSRCES